MEKVIPPGLNYADIKPEAIENQIRIVKFTPQSTVVQAKPNDVVRFFIQGNGFYDPYSAYIKIQVQPDVDFTTPAGPAAEQWAARLLDRSAHSLFSRLVIRCQGTELERIEQYDVVAAMINDMVYSSEQKSLHHYEGFPCKSASIGLPPVDLFGTQNQMNAVFHGSPGHEINSIGDVGWWRVNDTQTVIPANANTNTALDGIGVAGGGASTGFAAVAADIASAGMMAIGNGVPGSAAVPYSNTQARSVAGTGTTYISNAGNFNSVAPITFCIPIYSGILGVLMPDKKLLPMSLMPLEVEFTMNPYAFYPAGTDAYAPSQGRGYIVNKFEIFAHTLFFEQELHRSMEAIVAEHGIFIHYNSFYLAPITTWTVVAGGSTPAYAQINTYAKSINSIHFVFLKQGYEQTLNAPRKLQFISQQLNKLQIRNGLDLVPSESIVGDGNNGVGNSFSGNHSTFLIETYKAFNKMHDPSTDGAINAVNYNTDFVYPKANTMQQLITAQAYLGRSQYAVSLVGELLGEQQSVMCGRKGMMPFDINFAGNATAAGSYLMLIFTRADYILYVRPDLVVTRLGL